jgi:tRNA A-37 threonylcarbamoyl transferase component Bud32
MHVLIFEAVDPAETLREVWERVANIEEKAALLRSVLKVLGDHHQAGLMQKDLHLSNFLLSGKKIYTLDGSAIKIRKPPLSKRASLSNLVILLAALSGPNDALMRKLYPEYANLRGWRVKHGELFALERRIAQKRARNNRRYFHRKIFRECTPFKCTKSLTRFEIVNRKYDSPEMRRALANPDPYLSEGSFLKQGNTCTVAAITVDNRRFVIKRYNIKNTWHGVKRAFRETRAAISWRNAHRLMIYGIRTARPIALLENRIGPVRLTCYIVTEHVEGVSSFDYFRSAKVTLDKKKLVAERIVSVLDALARFGLSHGDTKATNFIIAAGEPVLMDLDAMREWKSTWAFRKACVKDVRRFMRNWEDRPDLMEMFQARFGCRLT